MRDQAEPMDASEADRPAATRPRPRPIAPPAAPPAEEPTTATPDPPAVRSPKSEPEATSRRRLGRFFSADQPDRGGVPRPVAPGQFPGVPRQDRTTPEPTEQAPRPRPQPRAAERPRPAAGTAATD